MKIPDIKCPYCDPDVGLVLNYDGMMYSGIEIRLLGRVGILRCRSFPLDNFDTYDTQDAVNIKFCPMCGRSFNDEDT